MSRHVVGVVLCALLVVCGWWHRMLASGMETRMSVLLPLNEPLASFPLELGPWCGKDVPLDERVLQQPDFDDSYVNRIYISPSKSGVVSVFIGYCGRPHRWLVHRPDICFPAHGRQRVSEESIDLTLSSGTRIPCILEEFRSDDSAVTHTLVLSTFIVNGRYSNNKHVRNATMFTKQAPYLTRVQLGLAASGSREIDLSVLRDVMERLIQPLNAFMPYMRG